MSVAVSLLLVGIDAEVPDPHLFDALTKTLLQINFSAVVMEGMPAFLLFPPPGLFYNSLMRSHDSHPCGWREACQTD